MSKATETAVKMIESLPESAQEKVVEELRALVEDVREEAKWDDLFERKKKGLVVGARKAREEIAAGKATDMDFDKLGKKRGHSAFLGEIGSGVFSRFCGRGIEAKPSLINFCAGGLQLD